MNRDLYISKVHLLSVPLENDYKNTLYFTDKDNQQSYFQSAKKFTFEDFYYIRKDNAIRVNKHYDELVNKGVNYLMYQNSAYSNKWFYCFITDIRYLNDECTELIVKTDVMQTWMFDIDVKSSFVEREHVSDDGVGKHTIPEGLETGDYICNKSQDDGLNHDLCVAIQYHDLPETGTTMNVEGGMLHGIYTSAIYDVGECNETGIEMINDTLNKFDRSAKADAVSSVFMFPKWITGSINTCIKPSTAPSVNIPTVKSCSVAKLTSLNGYTPKNKKLLTYPYYYLYASNGVGGNAIYQPELCSDSKFNFTIHGSLTPGCSIKMIPQNYSGVLEGYDYGLTGGKYPTCCWISDAYTNWLTENAVNNAYTGITAGLQIAGGFAVGGLVGGGMAMSGVKSIADAMVKTYNASLMPDQAKGNVNSGDVISGMGANKFMFYSMTIKKEFAQIIDRYFDMFGYKVNSVKKPNTGHRSRYWYTKTIDVNIDGNIPNKDMQEIKDCYNNGITFWRNASEIQNYDLSNDIV